MKIIKWTKYVSPETKFYDKVKNKKGMFITGQNGIVFPDDTIDKKFNMYEGSTNFIISVGDFNIMKGVTGVEMIYPITSYRVMVAIAKMFSEQEVLSKIDKAIDPHAGIHDEIISRYLSAAKLKYKDYVLFEDYYKMISITNEQNEPNLQGFTIFRANPRNSGV